MPTAVTVDRFAFLLGGIVRDAEMTGRAGTSQAQAQKGGLFVTKESFKRGNLNTFSARKYQLCTVMVLKISFGTGLLQSQAAVSKANA